MTLDPVKKGRMVGGAILGAIVGAFIALIFYAMDVGILSLAMVPLGAVMGGAQAVVGAGRGEEEED